jgi:hypothetical protein
VIVLITVHCPRLHWRRIVIADDAWRIRMTAELLPPAYLLSPSGGSAAQVGDEGIGLGKRWNHTEVDEDLAGVVEGT